MLEFSGEAFCRLSSMMGQLIVVLERGGIPDAKVVGASLGELDREAEKLQLRSVVQQLARVKAHILNGSANSSSLHPMIMELYNRMRDIMEDRLLLAIEPSRADLYRQESPLFGSETAEKFPSIAYDIEEAGKCLALDRSTASAFHAIRCLEAGLRAISRCLGIPDPTKGSDRSWANLLRAIKAEMDKRWPNSSHRMTGDGRYFEEAYGALSGIQNPWRNATMHLDQKYTTEEAQHVLDMVGGFMRKLASRCDEMGEPKA
jgi:hypothetical protein